MSVFEIMIFISQTMFGIITATDNVYLGEYSILDISVSLLYLRITFWGIFSLLSHKNNTEGVDE